MTHDVISDYRFHYFAFADVGPREREPTTALFPAFYMYSLPHSRILHITYAPVGPLV